MSDRDRKPPFRRSGGKPFEKGRKSPGRPTWRDREASPDGPVILYGWHTVAAALANPERHIRKLLVTENAARRLADENIDTRVTPEIVAIAAQFPENYPRDPADRLIGATARAFGMPLVTKDERIRSSR